MSERLVTAYRQYAQSAEGAGSVQPRVVQGLVDAVFDALTEFGTGTTTDCPLEGVHEHAFRGPHRFREWDPAGYVAPIAAALSAGTEPA